MVKVISRQLTSLLLLPMSFKLPSLFFKKLQAPLMSTTLSIKAKCAPKLLQEALVYAQEIEAMLSVYKETSLVSTINREAYKQPVALTSELYALLQDAIRVSEKTEGLFDITIGALTQITYKFGHNTPMLPNRNTLKKATSAVSYKNIILENSTVSFTHPNTSIDLGGIGKGYCVEALKIFLQEKGVRSGIISLGGEIVTFGGTFKVGIAHPRESKLYAYFETEGSHSISTSGDYERYIKDFSHNHIIDPNSGRSSSRYASLSLVSEHHNATILDAYNTAMFLMEEERLKAFAAQEKLVYLCLDKDLNEDVYKLEGAVKLFKRI